MPGCLEDAIAVAKGDFEKLEKSERVSSTEGNDDCSRTVYRVGDVVYKIDGGYQDNEAEYKILKYLAHQEWAPPVSLFDVEDQKILCMPYYANAWGRYANRNLLHQIVNTIEDAMVELGKKNYPTADLHDGNYRISEDGKIVVIDAAGNFNR